MSETPPHTESVETETGSSARDSAGPGLHPTENLNVEAILSLISPGEMHEQMPTSAETDRVVIEGRRDIQRILSGDDHRLLVIVGPCSIHDEKAALEYAGRLIKLREKVNDRLNLVMRVYFEKPRTTTGWKGLINDPHLNDSFDIEQGLRIARRLLLNITKLGLPTATELLEPFSPQYISDLLCWTAIGARTTESQTHRQMASGLSMPVGYKNSTDGNLQVGINAMKAARSPHAFLGVDLEGHISMIKTRGNPWGHLILRGGGGKSNFAPEDVAMAAKQLEEASLPTCLMVDCSHANSGKRPERQQVAWNSVIDQRLAGNDQLVGLMLESNLLPGNQPMRQSLDELKYGVSITDSCIGWDETETLILEAHERLAHVIAH